MGITLTDMDKVDALKGGAMLPVGRHTVRIDAATEGESSGGYPQVEIRFANNAGDIRDWIVFAPAKIEGQPSFAMQKAKALLDAVGIAPAPGKAEFPTEKLEGKALVIVVGEEVDNRGKTTEDGSPLMRRRVFSYEDAGSADPAPDTSDFGPENVTDSDDVPF